MNFLYSLKTLLINDWPKEYFQEITVIDLKEIYQSNNSDFQLCIEFLLDNGWPKQKLNFITLEHLKDVYSSNPLYFNNFLELLLENGWSIENINTFTIDYLKDIYQSDVSYFNECLEFLFLNDWPIENMKNLTLEYLKEVYQRDPKFFDQGITTVLSLGWPSANLQGITPGFIKELSGSALPGVLPDLADLKIHDYIESSETLANYGLFLIESCYEYPQILGRLNHHIIAIQAKLENRQNASNESSPMITQQNIIQMRSFVRSNEDEKIFDTGVMVVRSCGFLGKAKIIFESTDKPSPHPDFSFGRINLDGQNTPMLIYKDWEEADYKSININQLGREDVPGTDSEGKSITIKNALRVEKVLDSIKVKPLGVDPNFYYAYYLTQDNLVVKICLNMSLTKTLEQEGKKALSDLALYLENANSLDTSIPDGTITIDQALISHSASTFAEYIKVRYPKLVTEEAGHQLSWSKLLKEIKKNKDTVFADFPERYKSLIWHCNNEKAKEAGTSFIDANTDIIRFMTSDDLSIYFKVCQILKEFKVLDGSNLENSHMDAFRKKMDLIKVNESSEEVLVPHVILISPHPDVQDQPYGIEKQKDVESDKPIQTKDYPCKGKEIISRNPKLGHLISLQFQLKETITINGIVLTKVQFQDNTILPGSWIGF
jgi:hypothetical protein